MKMKNFANPILSLFEGYPRYLKVPGLSAQTEKETMPKIGLIWQKKTGYEK